VKPEHAIVLVAHGDRGGVARNEGLAAHARALSALGIYAHVSCAFLKGEPTLSEAFSRASASGASSIILVPVMMAEGYFSRVVLPREVAAAGASLPVTTTPVLGLRSEIASLIDQIACAEAQAHDLAPEAVTLMIVGHGSAIGPDARVPVDRAVATLHALNRFADVVPALVEESPTLGEAVACLTRPTIIVSLLASDGLHGDDDLSEALDSAEVPVFRTGALGSNPKIRPILQAMIMEAIIQAPAT
jgi:sirohydrochlorin ferrochelatase